MNLIRKINILINEIVFFHWLRTQTLLSSSVAPSCFLSMYVHGTHHVYGNSTVTYYKSPSLCIIFNAENNNNNWLLNGTFYFSEHHHIKYN